MSSQTSLVAEQVRLRQWATQIQECQSRPADMKVETWCSEHGITKANYYYRLRRGRKACLKACNPEPSFVELSIPATLQQQCHQQIPAMLNLQPFFETPEDWCLKSITTLQQISSEVFWRCYFMLNDATGLKKIYLAAGYTDLRRGIDDLATMIRFRFQLDPYDKNTLFLFCGKKKTASRVFYGKAMDFCFSTRD